MCNFEKVENSGMIFMYFLFNFSDQFLNYFEIVLENFIIFKYLFVLLKNKI